MQIQEDRPLTEAEVALISWLLRHGRADAGEYLCEVANLRVVSRCSCGCASVDFVLDSGAGLDVLADYQWRDQQGRLFGVFVFAKRGRLAGLEVWSIDGQATPASLPNVSVLQPVA